MIIYQELQEHVTNEGMLRRISVICPETGGGTLKAVIVNVPSGHEFPMHVHPQSEDCIFALTGTGELIEPGRTTPISAPACVWVPENRPHGLIAGPAGMLEVGIQIAGSTTVDFDKEGDEVTQHGLIMQAIPDAGLMTASDPGWTALCSGQAGKRTLHPCYAIVGESRRMLVEAEQGELAIFVVRGAISIHGAVEQRLDALGALLVFNNEAMEVSAIGGPALLIAVRKRGTGRQPFH